MKHRLGRHRAFERAEISPEFHILGCALQGFCGMNLEEIAGRIQFGPEREISLEYLSRR